MKGVASHKGKARLAQGLGPRLMTRFLLRASTPFLSMPPCYLLRIQDRVYHIIDLTNDWVDAVSRGRREEETRRIIQRRRAAAK